MRYNKTTIYLKLMILCFLPIACSTKPYGKITGQLIGDQSEKPLSGGFIVPCWIGNGTNATVILDLATKSDDDGKFEMPKIPPGKYILLYQMPNKGTQNENLEGLSVPVAIESILKFVLDMKSIKDSKKIPPIRAIDGLNGGITLQKGSTIEYDNTGLIIGGNGSFFLPEYGCSLNYEKGKVIAVKMPSRGVIDITIKAWGL
jgi:hypothetical protein